MLFSGAPRFEERDATKQFSKEDELAALSKKLSSCERVIFLRAVRAVRTHYRRSRNCSHGIGLQYPTGTVSTARERFCLLCLFIFSRCGSRHAETE